MIDEAKRGIKVLILFSAGELGGAERSLTRMAFASKDRMVDYRVATIGGEGEWARWARAHDSDIGVYSIGGGVRRSLSEYLRLVRNIRELRLDAIYVVGLRAAILIRLGKFLLGNVDVVHGIRSSFPKGSQLAATFRWPERILKRLTSLYVTNSTAGAITLSELAGVPVRNIHVIPNGIDVENYRIDARADVGPVVAVVANIHPLKGHQQFLDVAELVAKEIPGVLFKFVGRDDLGGKIQAESARRNLNGNIHFLGFQENIVPILRSSALFVLPSQVTEGAPTSILEAMASELPVVAYAVGGVPELVSDRVDGCLIKAGDAVGMADAIVALLRDKVRASALGRAARLKVEREFSVARCAEKHAIVLRQLCGSRSVGDS